jgi:prepilin-type N-terminal cleavage/methylation domain-containing protein
MNGRLSRLSDRSGFTLLEVLLVLAIFALVAAMAIPFGEAAVGGERLAGQARAVSYQVALAKMRASASFTRARVFFDFANRNYQLQTWDRTTSQWVTDGGVERLPRGVVFGFATATVPPPNTQSAIGQPEACREGLAAATNAVADSACVVFNSRGIPVDSTGAPTGENVVYVSDAGGSVVYAATVSATGMSQLWWTATANVAWRRQ